MASRVYPVDAIGGAPAFSGRAWRQSAVAPMLAGATPARPLGAFSGVRPGTSSSTVTVTSQTAFSVAPFAGVIDGEPAAEAGPYGFAFDAVVTGAITAANASNPRVDIVYVQISDPAESDGSSTPGVTIGYLAGSPASIPSAPMTPARTFVVAQFNVPKSGGGVPSVTWTAPESAAAGSAVSVYTLSALPATAAPGLRVRIRDTEVEYGSRRNSDGSYRWVRLGGGVWRGTRTQLIGSGAQSVIGAFVSDTTSTDRGEFATPGGTSVALPEGDYVATATYSPGTAVTGRSFVYLNIGAFFARGPFSAGEDQGSVTLPFHVGPTGGALATAVFQTSSGAQTGTLSLQILKSA